MSKNNPYCYLDLNTERYYSCDGHWKCCCPPIHYNNNNVALCYKGIPVYGDSTTHKIDVRCPDCIMLLESTLLLKKPEKPLSRFDDLELE